ncbi:VOC family protein [Cellulomonas sp. NS3]|uniref:VOC family protein n=1 Tax=Cellulomonas sp. NS3 TaxID=2973977 RepID=UPI0021616F52|nr:VOC family protein [Cellulomonas sp. NS3]
MPVRWYSVEVDCTDVRAQTAWWAQVLGWVVAYESGEESMLVPPHAFDASRDVPVEERGPGLCFGAVPERKQVKNRLHLDLAPRAGEDQAEAVERLLALGATRADVGQGADVSWIVLADPEGNEFCVLSPRD